MGQPNLRTFDFNDLLNDVIDSDSYKTSHYKQYPPNYCVDTVKYTHINGEKVVTTPVPYNRVVTE